MHWPADRGCVSDKGVSQSDREGIEPKGLRPFYIDYQDPFYRSPELRHRSFPLRLHLKRWVYYTLYSDRV